MSTELLRESSKKHEGSRGRIYPEPARRLVLQGHEANRLAG
jgi:hypothetical protein